MDHLNLLQISSPADGLVYLNGTLAGELLGGNLSLCIPRGRFCLSLPPLEQTEDRIYLPFARILDLSEEEPVIVRDDGVMSVYLLGEICCLRLSPPFASVPCLPYVVASHSFSHHNAAMRAQVYFDRVLCFSLEENGRIVFAAPLPFGAESGKMFTARLGSELCALAELEAGKEKMLACVSVSSRKLLFCEPCMGYKISQGVLDLDCPAGNCGYLLHKRFLGDLSRPVVSMVRHEGEKVNPALAFAAALQHRDAKTALSFLSGSLARELSFEDLLEFFGDAFPAPEEFAQPGELAFCEQLSAHIFLVRRFALELQDGKIYNISEQ